eukprot:COSAG06_NODE_24021_length_675_cov_0.795139_1_plen_225_part_11
MGVARHGLAAVVASPMMHSPLTDVQAQAGGVTLVVEGAGTEVYNGYYRYIGESNSRPIYQRLESFASASCHRIYACWCPDANGNGNYRYWWMYTHDYTTWSRQDAYAARLTSSREPPTSGWFSHNAQHGLTPAPTLRWLQPEDESELTACELAVQRGDASDGLKMVTILGERLAIYCSNGWGLMLTAGCTRDAVDVDYFRNTGRVNGGCSTAVGRNTATCKFSDE